MELNQAARAARNEYRRKWAKSNPDKVKEQQIRYWNKKAREMAAAADGKQEAER